MSSLEKDLQDLVGDVFSKGWTTRDGEVVPESTDLKLGKDAVTLTATVLYADMNGSTNLVDTHKADLAAEVYKAYLACAARILKEQGGTITAYDGDRIMAVFIGSLKNTNAVTAALKLNWAVKKIVNPGLKRQYGENAYQMGHVVGVDTSTLFVSRIGVRNDNDLVWVGRAANYAAKLTALNAGYSVYITGGAFNAIANSAKYGGDPQRLMWEPQTWTSMINMAIHCSNWIWEL